MNAIPYCDDSLAPFWPSYQSKVIGVLERALREQSCSHYEEKTLNEVALILGLTESNAKVKLHRIRKKIYVLMKQEKV